MNMYYHNNIYNWCYIIYDYNHISIIDKHIYIDMYVCMYVCMYVWLTVNE